MLMLISPAKTLDFESPAKTKQATQAAFLQDAEVLVDGLRALNPMKMSELMGISPELGDLNYGRMLNWHLPFNADNAKQAILAFKGDVYTGMDAESFKADDFKFAQRHLRILSGLYGVLRPLDLIQPYRLEMGTRFKTPRGDNLYDFWGDRITDALNQDLKKMKSGLLVNLASNEYFKAVKPKQLDADVITPVFRDYKNGQYKIISFFAKKARGMMAAYICKNRITTAKDLQGFNRAGYRFDRKASTKPNELVFLRDEAQ